MTRRQREELLKARLREEIIRVQDCIANSEVRIALPPADCKHLSLFVQLEETNLLFLKQELSSLTGRLARAEGQYQLAI